MTAHEDPRRRFRQQLLTNDFLDSLAAFLRQSECGFGFRRPRQSALRVAFPFFSQAYVGIFMASMDTERLCVDHVRPASRYRTSIW